MTSEELFLYAQELYKAKEYEQALAQYQSIADKEATIWYNIGNCAYRLGNFADARRYWKRAQRTASYEQCRDIEHNLRVLNEKEGAATCPTTGYFNQWLLRTRSISLGTLQIIFLFSWFCFFFLMPRLLRARQYILLIFLIILNGVLGVSVYMRYTQAHCCSGIVTASNVCLYAGPDSNYHTVGTLVAQTEFVIQEIRGNWYKIALNGQSGWICKDVCELV